MLATFKSALPSLMRRRVPIGLRAPKIHCSTISQQHRNHQTGPIAQTHRNFGQYNHDLEKNTNPRSLQAYNNKREQEAFSEYRSAKCGHPWLSPKHDPSKFDFTVYDLDHSLLAHEVSEVLGKPYLSEVEVLRCDDNMDGPQMFTGIFWNGTLSRPIVSLPASCMFYRAPIEVPESDKPKVPKWVHFLVCPNSPFSFVSREVSQETCFACLSADSAFLPGSQSFHWV